MAPSSPPWVSTFSQTLNIDSTGWSGFNLRQLINSALLSASGASTRLTLQASSAASCAIDGVYIGHQAGAGDLYDFDGGQAQALVSGSASFTINTGTSVVTDPIAFSFDHTKNAIVAVHFNTTSAVRGLAGIANATAYSKSAANETATSNVTGYAAGASALRLVSKIEVQ